jgi:hypothetical protein
MKKEAVEAVVVLCRNPIDLDPKTRQDLAVAINGMMLSGHLPEHTKNYKGWDKVFPAGSADIAIKKPFDGSSESLQVFRSLPIGKNGLRTDLQAFIDKAPQSPPKHTLPKRSLPQLHNRVMGDQLLEE